MPHLCNHSIWLEAELAGTHTGTHSYDSPQLITMLLKRSSCSNVYKQLIKGTVVLFPKHTICLYHHWTSRPGDADVSFTGGQRPSPRAQP